MFSTIDNESGIVCGVYTGQCIKALDIPPRSVMNCEHSWPQSRGAVGIAKSDLHHLFPVIAHVNSRRSNHPFCNVAVIKTEEDGSYLGESLEGTRCFEPRPEHKGDVARALFYFAVRYNKPIDQQQEKYLREWFVEDGVSQKEQLRNDKIERLQGNRNPFIDEPELIEFISDF
jgi:endonuclease I